MSRIVSWWRTECKRNVLRAFDDGEMPAPLKLTAFFIFSAIPNSCTTDALAARRRDEPPTGAVHLTAPAAGATPGLDAKAQGKHDHQTDPHDTTPKALHCMSISRDNRITLCGNSRASFRDLNEARNITDVLARWRTSGKCYNALMAKKKVILETLATEMRKGFASVGKHITSIEERMNKGFSSVEARMERGFAATADDIAHLATKHDLMATEKRLNDRIDGVRIKVDGLQNERDAEALQRQDQKIPERLADLEEKVFGRSRA
jgi:hypothetical protein